MLHTVLIVLHAGAGVACFAAGLLSIPVQTSGTWRFRVYAGSLLAMLGFVAGAIGVSWAGLELTSRLVFSGLFGLGLYMAWRAWRAWGRLRRPVPGWRARYLDDVGFTLISLFDGFVIVAAIDLGLPGWLVALVALSGTAGGIYAMNRVKARLARQPAGPAGSAGGGLPRSGAAMDQHHEPPIVRQSRAGSGQRANREPKSLVEAREAPPT